MNSGFPLRAKAAWTLGFVVVLAAFVPVLLFIAQSLTGLTLLPDGLPQFSNAWLDGFAARLPFSARSWMPRTLPPGLAVALLGLLAMVIGAAIARRQVEVLDAHKRGMEDRLRRVRQYAGGADALEERIEPYIGAPVKMAVGFDRR
jgi:hypothetical protein